MPAEKAHFLPKQFSFSAQSNAITDERAEQYGENGTTKGREPAYRSFAIKAPTVCSHVGKVHFRFHFIPQSTTSVVTFPQMSLTNPWT